MGVKINADLNNLTKKPIFLCRVMGSRLTLRHFNQWCNDMKSIDNSML